MQFAILGRYCAFADRTIIAIVIVMAGLYRPILFVNAEKLHYLLRHDFLVPRGEPDSNIHEIKIRLESIIPRREVFKPLRIPRRMLICRKLLENLADGLPELHLRRNIDRLSGSFVGIYESTVTDQFVDYVRPQDNGYKCDVRWAEFMDDAGRGVRFSADKPLFMQALHYSWDDLNYSRHQNGQVQFRTPLVKRAEVMLNLDIRQLGLGGSSCGPGPLAKYIFDPLEPVAWTMKLEPVLPARKSRP